MNETTGPGKKTRKTAVALDYEPARHVAPIVVASGQGQVAERIIELARQHGVPIKEDPDLIQILAKLDLGEAIPPELYPVIAEIFAFIHLLNQKKAGLAPAANNL